MSSSSQNDLDSLFKKVKSADFHPQKDSILEWAQSTVLNTIKLFMSNYFPLNDQSKADILRRIWLFLGTVFDYSVVKSRRYFFFVLLTILLTIILKWGKNQFIIFW